VYTLGPNTSSSNAYVQQVTIAGAGAGKYTVWFSCEVLSDTLIVADPYNAGLVKPNYDGVRYQFDDGTTTFSGGPTVSIARPEPGWQPVVFSVELSTAYVVNPSFYIRLAVAPGHVRAYMRKMNIVYYRHN
jgi:hypothetical protein